MAFSQFKYHFLMMIGSTYIWRPIEDLPADWHALRSSELRALSTVWADQKDLLLNSENLRRFNERLHRQWAIETGVIERVYTLDRGITQLLIEEGIDAALIPNEATDKDPHLVGAIIQDHLDAVDGIFDFVKGSRQLTTSYVKELHALLTRNQNTAQAIDTLGRYVEVPLLHGAFKEQSNNPRRPDGTIHEYCPPEHVAAEMDRLVELHEKHLAADVPPEVEAAWLHHRFTQIHPFQDGNGRVVRALATLVLLRAGWFPLVVTRDDRLAYIDALEIADSGDLQPFVNLIAALERRAFVSALGIASDVLERDRVDQVIAATRDLLQRRQDALVAEWQQAKEVAAALLETGAKEFQQTVDRLAAEIAHFFDHHWFTVDLEHYSGDRDYYFRKQIIDTAKELNYFANTSEYRSWARIILRTDSQAEILLSFHGIGHEFRGVLAASMCFFRREVTEQGEREVSETVRLTPEVFQINYRESLQTTRDRFVRWLDKGLVAGLELWRAGL